MNRDGPGKLSQGIYDHQHGYIDSGANFFAAGFLDIDPFLQISRAPLGTSPSARVTMPIFCQMTVRVSRLLASF